MSQNHDALGNNAKSSSGEQVDIALRYALQSIAAGILPKERVSVCSRKLIPLVKDVEVRRASTGKSAWYRGLQICASVWACPVCASRITEGRRLEIQQCLDGVNCRKVLVTYTLRHVRRDSLQSVLDGLKKAYESMWSGRWMVKFKAEWGYLGQIKSTEVTYGDNGFHPHLHCIMFLDVLASTEDIEGEFTDKLKLRWLHCLALHGQDASWEYGLKVDFVYDGVAEYVAKWGHEPNDKIGWNIASEVAKAPSKKAHKDGRTMLSLLFDAAYGDKQARALWKVYALTFKGTAQLFISANIRLLAGLPSKQASDADLASDVSMDSYLFSKIDRHDWFVILRNGARGKVIELVRSGDYEEFMDYLQSIGCKFGQFETATDMMWRLVNERPYR